ncbi:protein RKD1-like [Gossypium hirsutum]|nr:protein RKD1-like [Gossypium hirsutum]
MDQAGNSNNNQEKPAKPSLAVQRERTRNLTLKEIENYFHLPIEKAAKKMEFSATVVKKICRKYGLSRWPHRKIQSMEKKISNWVESLSSNDPKERARAKKEIENLQREIAKFGEGSSKLGDD